MPSGRPHKLALTPEQIEEARCLKATRSWPQLAKRYKVSINQVRYALNADQERARAQKRDQHRRQDRTRDHKAERDQRKAKAAALGFRSVYQMEKVQSGKATIPKPRLTMQVPWAVPAVPGPTQNGRESQNP